MIEITINKPFKANDLIGFKASGHANTDVKGKDIVCAAVSALTQIAALGIMQYRPNDFFIGTDNGYLDIALPWHYDGNIMTIINVMELGLNEIEKQYPDKVKVIVI